MCDIIAVYDGKYLASVFIRQEFSSVKTVFNVLFVVIHYGYYSSDLYVGEFLKPLYPLFDSLSAAEQVIDDYYLFSILGSMTADESVFTVRLHSPYLFDKAIAVAAEKLIP